MAFPAPDHFGVYDATELLISQYASLPNITNILSIFAARYQNLEQQIWNVINGRLLGSVNTLTPTFDALSVTDAENLPINYEPSLLNATPTTVNLNASGVQLDTLGELIGIQRYGLSDPDFLLFLEAQIDANNGSGSSERVTQSLGILLGLSYGPTYNYVEYPPGFEVQFTAPLPAGFPLYNFAQLISETRSAGVYGNVTYYVSNTYPRFSFSLGTTGSTGHHNGFEYSALPGTFGGLLKAAVGV